MKVPAMATWERLKNHRFAEQLFSAKTSELVVELKDEDNNK